MKRKIDLKMLCTFLYLHNNNDENYDGQTDKNNKLCKNYKR